MDTFPQGSQLVCTAVGAGRGEWHGPSPKRQNRGTGAQHPSLLPILLLSVLGLPPLLPPWPISSPLLLSFAHRPPFVSRQLAIQSLAAQEDRAESLKWLMCPAPQRSKSQAPDWLVGPRMRAGWVCWRQVGMSTSAGSLLSLSRSLAASRLCCRIGVGRADLVCAPPYS